MQICFSALSTQPVNLPAKFGQAKKPDESTSSQPPSQSEPNEPLQDPKPKHGVQNLKNAAIMAMGLGAFGVLPGQVANMHEAAVERSAQVESIDLKGVQSVSEATETTFDMLSSAAVKSKDIPMGEGLQNLYVLMLQWQLLTLGAVAGLNMRKNTLDLKDVYGELHQRGLTGKGIKVGVVDSGYRTRLGLPKKNLRYQPLDQADKKRTGYKDPNGHGTAVTNLIASALPEAEFTVSNYVTRKDKVKIAKDFKKLFKEARQNPESLTVDKVRQVFTPLVENIAQGVRKSVDDGAQVVNVSLSVEQATQMMLMLKLMQSLTVLGAKRVFSTKAGRKSEDYQNARRLFERLGDLVVDKKDDKLTEATRAIYQPWLEALDYAHSKGAAVIVAAGNSGGHKNMDPEALGNTNLLGGFKHPALITVGSTDENGAVSKFSSEFNDLITPDLAANGSGEVSTQGRISRTGLLGALSKAYAPLLGALAKVKYQNPKGTSFAAPDVTALYGMIKAVNPDLTTEEIKSVMLEAAQQVHFSPKQLEAIKKEVAKQAVFSPKQLATELEALKKEVEARGEQPSDSIYELGKRARRKPLGERVEEGVQAKLKRRVGEGTLAGRRLQAVQLAEQRKPVVEQNENPEK